jgi:di/tricarboxylate transporter
MSDPQTIALLRQLGVDPAALESLLASAAILTVLMLVTAIPTAIIAGRKNRSRGWWVLFALSIPVLPLLLVWLLPALPAGRSSKP